MEKNKNLVMAKSLSMNGDDKNQFGLSSLNEKLRKTEPLTFNNYYVDLRELLSDNFEYK